MIFLEEQLELICALQGAIRSPAADAFLRACNLLDTGAFISSMIVFAWFAISWRWGIRLSMLLLANSIANGLAKIAFALPRPFDIDPALALVKVYGYGFPSGGAQTSLLIGGLIIAYWKSPWAWPVGLAYALTVSASRILLGVHFPLDVLGGWIIGACLLAAFTRLRDPIEAYAARRPAPLLALALALAAALFIALPFFLKRLAGSFAAVSLGTYLSTRCGLYVTLPDAAWKRYALGLFAIGTAALLTALIAHAPLPQPWKGTLHFAAEGLWISLFLSPICKKIFNLKSHP